MKKFLSLFLVLATMLACFPLGAYAETLYKVESSVSYEDDLIIIKFDITANTDEDGGITDLELMYNSNVSNLRSCLSFVSIDLSGLPAGGTWEQMAINDVITAENKLNIQIMNQEFDAPIYSATQNVSFSITLRKSADTDVEQISFTLYSFTIIDMIFDEYVYLASDTPADFSMPSAIALDLTAKATTETTAAPALTPTIELLGAQKRLTAPQGLRFIAKLTKDEFYESFGITENYSYAANASTVSFGVLIAISANVSGSLTHESSCKKLDIVAEKILSETDEYISFTGVIIGFPEDGSYDDTMFTAVAYVKAGNNYYYSSSLDRSVNYVTEHAATAAA